MFNKPIGKIISHNDAPIVCIKYIYFLHNKIKGRIILLINHTKLSLLKRISLMCRICTFFSVTGHIWFLVSVYQIFNSSQWSLITRFHFMKYNIRTQCPGPCTLVNWGHVSVCTLCACASPGSQHYPHCARMRTLSFVMVHGASHWLIALWDCDQLNPGYCPDTELVAHCLQIYIAALKHR